MMKPLFNRVVIEVIEVKKETAHGIVLPESMTKPNENTGKVVAVGEGIYQNGTLLPMTVKVGDTVLFSRAGGLPFILEDKSYLIFDESSILAILD